MGFEPATSGLAINYLSRFDLGQWKSKESASSLTYMDLPQSMHEMNVGQSLQPPPPPPKKKKASVWTERRMTTRHANENKVEDFIFESSFFVSSASDFRELFRQLLKTFFGKIRNPATLKQVELSSGCCCRWSWWRSCWWWWCCCCCLRWGRESKNSLYHFSPSPSKIVIVYVFQPRKSNLRKWFSELV